MVTPLAAAIRLELERANVAARFGPHYADDLIREQMARHMADWYTWLTVKSVPALNGSTLKMRRS